MISWFLAPLGYDSTTWNIWDQHVSPGRDTVTPPAAAVGVVRTARAELPQAQTEI